MIGLTVLLRAKGKDGEIKCTFMCAKLVFTLAAIGWVYVAPLPLGLARKDRNPYRLFKSGNISLCDESTEESESTKWMK